MGGIVVSEFVSLDGVMEDPGGAEGARHAGWTFGFDALAPLPLAEQDHSLWLGDLAAEGQSIVRRLFVVLRPVRMNPGRHQRGSCRRGPR